MLKDNQVHTEFVRKIDGPCGHTVIQVDKNGQNGILLYGGSNRRLTKEFVDEVIEGFEAGDYILLQNEINQLDYIIDRAYENGMKVVLQEDNEFLEESVVTALGIRKDKKSLGYAVEEVKASELMLNKNANAINSLAGKVAGVSVTQSSGSAGAGAQIILRGGTSLERDNQPLFVVDGIIYDNSAGVVGNSGFDGSMNTATTNSNRVMEKVLPLLLFTAPALPPV